MIIPVVITVYTDNHFLCDKTPPAAVLLKKTQSLPLQVNRTKVATLTTDQVEIAKLKMPDLNAADLDSATEMIKGTAKYGNRHS